MLLSPSRLTGIKTMTICKCGKEIQTERAELGFKVCTGCSTEQKLVGFMDYSHKTAAPIILIDPKNKEDLRKAKRVNERSR